MNNPKIETFSGLFESLLKEPKVLIEQIGENKNPSRIIVKLLLIALGGFLIFGITLGSFSFHNQLWAAPLKTILGITLSTVICLPSLYVFSALTGTTLGMKEVVQGMSGALALIAGLLLGLTPALWVFSQSTSSEGFFGFLVLATWLVALFFGTGFLLKMLTQSGTTKTAPLRIWIGIFLLVTLQMSTTLRPLIGKSETLFTTEKRFFVEHWRLVLSPPNNPPRAENQPTNLDSSKPKEPEPSGSSKRNPFLDE